MKKLMVPDPKIWGMLGLQAGQKYIVREILQPIQEFIAVEGRSGLFLFAAALLALIWANSPWSPAYYALWQTPITVDLGFFSISKDLHHWINEGIMTIFFFVVGLEVKRELAHGELKEPRKALLPVFAAAGGMLVPLSIYLLLNANGHGEAGWGIPMATDIAFALGVLALLGKRIPNALRIFLLTFAIVDDIGAILVIAIFYSTSISVEALGAALLVLGWLFIMNRMGVRQLAVYAAASVLFWFALLQSGIHATLAGVILGLLAPASPRYSIQEFGQILKNLMQQFQKAVERSDQDQAEKLLSQLAEASQGAEPPLERLERLAHPWSSYFVIPLFALANAGVLITLETLQMGLGSPVTLGVAIGLLAGKIIGILLFCWLAVRLGLSLLPDELMWRQIAGAAMLGGIGFTVSLFIAGLAFSDEALVAEAKLGILAASLIAGSIGFLYLRWQGRPAIPSK